MPEIEPTCFIAAGGFGAGGFGAGGFGAGGFGDAGFGDAGCFVFFFFWFALGEPGCLCI